MNALTDTQALTEMQEAFAVNYATNGGNGKLAAIEAGYSETSAAVLASRMVRNPLIQQRIAAECNMVMAQNVPLALAAQRRIIESGKSDMVKHLVAQDMLDRVLGKATQKVQASLDSSLTVSIDLS